MGFRPGRDAWPGNDEGNAQRMFVEVLFANQTVAATRHTGVRTEHHEGVRGIRRSCQRIEYAPNLDVEEGNVAVIVGIHRLDRLGAARVRQQQFIPNRHLAVVERMLRQEVRRQEPFVGCVTHRIIVRHDVGIVRPIKGDITEEGAALVLPQEPQRLVRKHLTGMFGRWLRRR